MASLEAIFGKAIIRESPFGIVVIDAKQRIRYFNPAAEKIFGYSSQEVTGQPMAILLPPEFRKAHEGHVQTFYQSQGGTRQMGERGEIWGLRYNGQRFAAEATITRVESGDMTYLIALLNDRTHAREKEAERQRLAQILQATPDFVGMADPRGQVVFRNRSAQKLLGNEPDEFPHSEHVRESHPPEDAERVLEEAFPLANQEGFWEGETRLLDHSGSAFPVSQIIIAHHGEDGDVEYYSTIARDLRPYRRAEDRLRTLFSALDQAADLIWITDTEGVVEYVNPTFEAVTGYSDSEARGQKVGTLMKSGRHDEAFYARMWAQLLEGKPYRDVFTNRTRDGQEIHIDETITPVRDSQGHITHFVATGRDITERLELEDRLRQLAYYDPLTGLPNRTHFHEHLQKSLLRAERHGYSLALMLLDLDRFKDLNDSLGHAAGDELLGLLAERVRGALRSADFLARLGGDEFVLLMESSEGEEGAIRVAETLLEELDAPFQIQGHPFRPHASIGISLFPEDSREADKLLQEADQALYKAKDSGGNSYRFYSPEYSRMARERFQLEKGLHQAVAEDGCLPYFQPLIDLAQGSVIGAEALARCRNPETSEWLSPAEFIPVAERSGLIHPLGLKILEQACQSFQAWRHAGHNIRYLSVNLSPVQLTERGFADKASALLDDLGMNPACLELEITEEVELWTEEVALDELCRLNRLGVGIALDDFGQGYSSPANLQKLPVTRMKLDRAFVQGVDRDKGNQAILKGLLGFARGFGCSVTAEGVETQAEADYLSKLEVGTFQGFFFGRPVPSTEFETLLGSDQ